MAWFESLILGIVQGLTEFLPVSSSGHLELGKAILGDNSLPQESMLFTVVLHFATALSTLVIFRKEVLGIVRGLWQFQQNDAFFFSLKIIISMLPAALVGVLYADLIEQLFNQQILLVGLMLLLTGGLLFLSEQARAKNQDMSFFQAFIVGISQAIAILPGISRSGATISTSILLGVDRSKAAYFSFMMVVPLILGKIAKDIYDGALSVHSEQLNVLAVGFVAAFLTGLFACKWMISLVRNSRLKYFSYYCFVIGSVAVISQLV